MKTVREFAETLTCPRINISHTHCEVINLFPVKKKKKKKKQTQSLSAAQASPALKTIKANALSLIYSHITHVVAVSRAS